MCTLDKKTKPFKGLRNIIYSGCVGREQSPVDVDGACLEEISSYCYNTYMVP